MKIKKYTLVLPLLTVLLLLLSGACSWVSAQSSGLEALWDDGIKFRSKDGLYRFSVGGRVHYDIAFLKHSKALDTLFEKVSDRVEVRRARLSFEGSINQALAYEFEFTFGETLEYADMYFAFFRVPYFERLTVGHFREPFGMEELTSSNAIVFMERSLTSAFGPSRNTGVMLQRQYLQDKLRAYAGIFRVTDDLGGDLMGQGKHSYTGRLAYNPVWDTTANKAVHFGLGINTSVPLDNEYNIKTQNETHTAPAYINTGMIRGVKRVAQVGGEVGYTKNKLTLQGEYIQSAARIDSITNGTINRFKRNASSFYAMASYFLKGGIRRYNKSGNRFSAVALTERYEQGSMSGAWEVGVRLSHINVADAVHQIKRLSDMTLGVNWYFNSNSRVMLNYVLSRMSQNHLSSALQLRMQLTF